MHERLESCRYWRRLESPLGCKEIKPVNLKGNQSWTFIRRIDAEAEAPRLWPPDVKCWFTGKDPDTGKDWRQEEKGMTEGEMVGWHHQLNGYEFEQAPGYGEGPGSLEYCSPWDCKEPDTIKEQQQQNEWIYLIPQQLNHQNSLSCLVLKDCIYFLLELIIYKC